MKVTESQLKAFAPKAQDVPLLVQALNQCFDKYEINTPRRVRYFMAQSHFETQGFTKFVENLVYTSSERIATVWPTRFYSTTGITKVGRGPLDAAQYVRNAEKLSNEVYANRFGNGDAASGDGWKFRGRGFFHLTFRGNYHAASMECTGSDLWITNPDEVAKYPGLALSAGWFWKANKLNALADSDSFTRMTGVINGSEVTAPQRLLVLREANKIFV